MKKTRNSSLGSASVIATALLLGASPGFAQSAETTVSPFPEVTAPAPLPETSTTTAPDPVMVSSPVVQPVPEPEPEAAPVAAAEPDAASATTRTVQRAAAPRANAAAPVAPVAVADPAPAPELPAAPAEVAPFDVTQTVPVVDEAPTQVADNQLTNDLLPIALGGLAVLALAIWGFVAIGRRKPVDRLAATSIRPAPKPVERPLPATLAASPVVAEPVPMPPVTAEPVRSWNQAPSSIHPTIMAHSGAGVALPRSVPASFAERDALLKRMVAAKPDRANPFVGYKARMKRARLILQSLDRDFTDAEPWIDLSQYSANWPELSRNKTAAA